MKARKSPTLLAAIVLVFAVGLGSAQSPTKDLTIIFTNDFHSAFDPIPAYWLKGSPTIGGAAHLATLANQIRRREKTTFFFDTGDMFTGQLSFLTKGEALMEMMRVMNYDAMVIGNHEFDYGADNFDKQMNRVEFPVLGANIVFKGTDHRYSRPYTIIERNGVRLGVIGIIGQDARSVALPSGITNLDFPDPIPVVRQLVKELEPQVDLVVVLAHQGKTGPMQSDAEAVPEVQRDFDEDIRMANEVEGIDILIGGHAHRGIEEPYVAKSGTLIMQTYGYGTRLGYMRLKVSDGKVVSHKGELLKVWSSQLPADPAVTAKLNYYKKKFEPVIGVVQGNIKVNLSRDYRRESPLGNFVTDVLREVSGADVGITNAGGLRADLWKGKVTNGNIYDALPFVNSLVICEMTGAQIKEILEQGFTLERGMIQASGLKAVYDMSRPLGSRLVSLEIGGAKADDSRTYKVATNSFIAQGGDLYQTFLKTKQTDMGKLLSEVVMDYIREKKVIGAPVPGRLVPVTR